MMLIVVLIIAHGWNSLFSDFIQSIGWCFVGITKAFAARPRKNPFLNNPSLYSNKQACFLFVLHDVDGLIEDYKLSMNRRDCFTIWWEGRNLGDVPNYGFILWLLFHHYTFVILSFYIATLELIVTLKIKMTPVMAPCFRWMIIWAETLAIAWMRRTPLVVSSMTLFFVNGNTSMKL